MIKRILSSLVILLFCVTVSAQQQVYELRTYELEFFTKADVLHNYFEQALIPALNRQGIATVGAFEEAGERLPRKLYLLIPFDNIQAFADSKDLLAKDQKYLKDADDYLKTSPELIPFRIVSTDLISAASGFPELVKPANDATFFELRIYESYNEDALRRKVKMFNDSEFKIFDDVGLPMVFFGANIAGSQMPCLTYLLAFKDEAARASGWAKFGPHPEWQRILKLEEYANTVSDITRVFLKPLSYSQL